MEKWRDFTGSQNAKRRERREMKDWNAGRKIDETEGNKCTNTLRKPETKGSMEREKEKKKTRKSTTRNIVPRIEKMNEFFGNEKTSGQKCVSLSSLSTRRRSPDAANNCIHYVLKENMLSYERLKSRRKYNLPSMNGKLMCVMTTE